MEKYRIIVVVYSDTCPDGDEQSYTGTLLGFEFTAAIIERTPGFRRWDRIFITQLYHMAPVADVRSVC